MKFELFTNKHARTVFLKPSPQSFFMLLLIPGGDVQLNPGSPTLKKHKENVIRNILKMGNLSVST